MKKLLLLLIFYISIFPIYIENVDHLERHIHLSVKKNFESIGVVYSDGCYGTGTIIHPNVILTAAHVVKDQNNIRFQIIINGKTIDLSAKAVYHPDFTHSTNSNIDRQDMKVDLALVFVSEPILEIDYPTLAEYIPPLLTRYYATGYGLWNGAMPHYYLDRKLTSIVSIEEITNDLIITSCINKNKIDLFGSGRSGDSGGPLMTIDKENLIHGLLSCTIYEKDRKNDEDSYKKDPSFTIYPKIHNHIDWILETIEANIDD